MNNESDAKSIRPKGADDAVTEGRKLSVVRGEEHRALLDVVSSSMKPRAEILSAKAVRGPRPEVIVEGNLHDLIAHVGKVFKAHNEPPGLFQQGGDIIRISVDEEGSAITRTVGRDLFKSIVADCADFKKVKLVKVGKEFEEQEYEVYPPDAVVKALHEDPDCAGIPTLASITRFPIMSRDGFVRTQPGYDRETQTFFMPLPGVTMRDVPVQPTGEDIAYAKNMMAKELLGDFCFAEDGKDWRGNPCSASFAHAFGFGLEPVLRSQMDRNSSTPLHLAQACEKNAGKSKLIRSLILCGACADPDELTPVGQDNEEEWSKQIARCLKSAPGAILIDNVRGGQLNSAILDRALTSPVFSSRKMGSLDSVILRNRKSWGATANNAEMHPDTARRLVYISLEHNTADKVFKNGEIVKWTRDNLAELAWSTRVLVRGWVVAGRPKWRDLRPADEKHKDDAPIRFDSFEDWAACMGGILDWLGIPGFLTNYEKEQQKVDVHGVETVEFFEALYERFPNGAWFSAGEACALLEAVDETGYKRHRLASAIDLKAGEDIHGRNAAGRIGKWMKAHANQSKAGIRLRYDPNAPKRKYYQVTKEGTEADDEFMVIDEIPL